ncbi:MAG TPA: peptidoglycan-binding domain-containing protein, partial [Kiloniellales bacterium]
DKGTIDLGEPVWKRGQSQSGAAPASGASASSASNPVVRRIQAALADRGYDPGPIDGRSGPRTRAAIGAYQRDHGLFVDSTPTPELAQHLENS